MQTSQFAFKVSANLPAQSQYRELLRRAVDGVGEDSVVIRAVPHFLTPDVA